MISCDSVKPPESRPAVPSTKRRIPNLPPPKNEAESDGPCLMGFTSRNTPTVASVAGAENSAVTSGPAGTRSRLAALSKDDKVNESIISIGSARKEWKGERATGAAASFYQKAPAPSRASRRRRAFGLRLGARTWRLTAVKASRPAKNVIFDIGNVLLAWDPAALLRRFVAPDVHEAYLRGIFLHQDWVELDRGTLEEEAALEGFCARLDAPIDDVRDLLLAAKVSLTPIADGVRLLEELHDLGVRLYCITNMARGTYEFVRRRYTFWERFRGIVVSAHVRMVKPDPAIYRHALATFQIDASETVFLDDKLDNVEAAGSVGMRPIHYTSSTQVRTMLLAS